MNATHRKPASQLEFSDEQYSKRLMVDELIEQLIRRQISEAWVQNHEPGGSQRGKVIPLR